MTKDPTTKRSRSLVEIPGIAICLAERRNMVLRCFQDGFLGHVHEYLGFLVKERLAEKFCSASRAK